MCLYYDWRHLEGAEVERLLSYMLGLLLQLQLSSNSLLSRLWLGCRLDSSWQSSQDRDREDGRGGDHAEARGAQL